MTLPQFFPPARRLLSGAILLFVLSGCSSFDSAWREAARQPDAQNALTGRWQGTWLSDVNAHTGQLLCIVTAQTNGLYAARFRATYMKVLRFSYTVPLQVECQAGVWTFAGSENLGSLAGGVYRYVGTASATNFHSTYDSKYDRGVFHMTRP